MRIPGGVMSQGFQPISVIGRQECLDAANQYEGQCACKTRPGCVSLGSDYGRCSRNFPGKKVAVFICLCEAVAVSRDPVFKIFPNGSLQRLVQGSSTPSGM
ncbi:hypothetical protein E2C01_068186 [Portunus trituberculatus]|uniref:Uncharacterized protein n=1 Tax=Portunus trituberculatus TaxID=210409 RepID=A0A5B7HVV2_PORTR|nr:hypothetical protein [Portunus trituberculatus]